MEEENDVDILDDEAKVPMEAVERPILRRRALLPKHPDEFECRLIEAGLDLLWEEYNILADVYMRLPTGTKRPIDPLSGLITVYAE